jgi:hypothetical protein
MGKKLVGFGVFALAMSAAAGTTQAKLVRYEIDGQRYSYSTNNIQQTREARRRIEAANAASAAKAQAEAERASNPIVKLFGSRAQREAAAAQARLEETLGSRAPREESADLESTSSVKKSRAEARRDKRGVRARAEQREALREARRERRMLAEERNERRRLANARAQRQAALSHETHRADVRKQVPGRQEARHRAEPPLPAVETIQVKSEQPSRNSLPETGSRESAASLMDFVNQVRKALP